MKTKQTKKHKNGSKLKMTTILLSKDEHDYAFKISTEMPYACPRVGGSVAHALKSLLHMNAKQIGVKLNGSNCFTKTIP